MKSVYSIKKAWHGLIMLVAFLPLVILLIWVGLVVHNILLEKSLQQEKVMQDLVHNGVVQEVSRLTTMLENKSDPMAYILSLKQDHNLLSQLFKKVLEREPSMHLLVLFDSEGRIILEEENYVTKNSTTSGLSEHLNGITSLSGKLAVPMQGKIYIASNGIHSEGVFITISVPVIMNEKKQGVLLAEIDANILFHSIKRHMVRDGINSYITDESGLLLVAPDNSQFDVGEDVSKLFLVKAIMNDQKWPTERKYEGINGLEVYGSYTSIGDLDWKIVTEVERDIIVQPIYELILNLALVSGVVVFLLLILGVRLVDRVIRPVQEIADDFKRVGKQDLMPSTIESSFSELDSMVDGFNQMVKEISRKQQHLTKASIVFENTSEGIVITDTRPNILSVNNAFTTVTGYSEDEVIGKDPSFLKSGAHDDHFYEEMWRALEDTGHWQGEIQNRRKNGEIYTELLSINSFNDVHGEPVEYIGVFADISKIKETENKLEHLAHYDPLTNLPNRLLCHVRMEHEMQYAERNEKLVAILLLDLDMFKNINDSLGHVMGDKLLQEVTERLKQRVRDEDTIARLGGDEFVLIIGSLEDRKNVSEIAMDILKLFSESFDIGEHEVFIGASIGISVFPDDARDVGSLLQNADAAMYRAKAEGRDNYQYYTSELTSSANQRLSTEFYLRHALEKNELILHYQPQYSAATGEMLAVEALIRWQHPIDGLVFPDKFISVAEETGLIVPIGEWVIETACKQLRKWQQSGCPELRMAINLSARQFRKSGLAKTVSRIFNETEVKPHQIDLELTESIIMRDADSTIATLDEFHEMGVELSIDDFGTGYSSLSYLKRFPINRLKIDREFVRNITTDKSDADLIKSIIALGHCMNLKVLAEGVEDIEQLNYLKEHGCDEIQGYYYSKPIPADELEALCKKEKD